MRVPLSWLREYVDIQLTPEQALTLYLDTAGNALTIGSGLERFDNHLDRGQLGFELLQHG